MEDKKISQLTASTLPLTGTEEIAIVQGGETKKVTISNIPNSQDLRIISEVKTKSITHTGTTAETFIRSILIPANTLTANELLTINSLSLKTGSGVCNSRIRLGQSITPSVSNPVVIFNISSNAFRCINKKLLIQDGNVLFSNIGLADDFEFTNQPFSLTFNHVVDNWLHMSVQLVTSSDTIYIANSKLSK
tara:strand:- start:20121 stop:20693 length:573 start_codon:yes stop_codon:yes gene_type:complete